MKTIISRFCLALLFAVSASCSIDSPRYDFDISLLLDVTDSMSAYPTANEITAPLDLKTHPWQCVHIRISYLTDREVNDVKVVTLEAENQWTGNLPQRKGKIEQFKKRLAQCLTVKPNISLPYSIIFKGAANEANRLAASTATKRYLLVYSDLCEHTPDISFYDKHTLARLQQSPQSVANQFETLASLKSLNGVDVWLLYNPANYTENTAYMPIAEFYQHLFSAHGAVVHIANKFQLL